MNKKRIKLNIIDLIMIAVVIGVMAFLGMKFYQKKQVQQNTVNIKYTVELTGYDLTFFDSINIGDIVNISIREKAMATIIDVSEPEIQEYSAYNADTGTYTLQKVPEGDLYKMNITLSSQAVDYEHSYKVVGTDIRVGESLYVQGMGYIGKGYIITTEIVNE